MDSLGLDFLKALITGVINSFKKPGVCSNVGNYLWMKLMIKPLMCEPS